MVFFKVGLRITLPQDGGTISNLGLNVALLSAMAIDNTRPESLWTINNARADLLLTNVMPPDLAWLKKHPEELELYMFNKIRTLPGSWPVATY